MVVRHLSSYSYHLFGEYFKKRRDRYFDLRQELLKTRMNISYDMYLSLAVMCSILMSITGLTLAILFVSLFGAPDITLTRSVITDIFESFHQYKNVFLAVSTIVFFIVIFGGGTYVAFLNYPKLVNSDRRRNIELMLPYAVHYMSAMSGAGVIPVDIMSSLAKNKIYGEAAKEASYIVRDIKVMGNDLVHAMKTVAATTPSYRYQEFLQGAITIVSSGGDLEAYFKIKAEQYVIENRRQQKEFLETLGLIAETYITAFVAGPLFLIVMMSIMATMGGMDLMLMYLLIYVAIPIATIIFVILISSITPEV
ncbi:MAG: type II secretion system F family protein [Methanosarcinales archaeon]|nr:type II secretion system F family protein [Methanosarcinales archaeon]